MSKRRYLVALGGILLHLMIGSVYAWSVFTGPIAKQTAGHYQQLRLRLALPSFF